MNRETMTVFGSIIFSIIQCQAENAQTIATVMELNKTDYKQCTIYYEDCFEGKLEIFKKEYERYLERSARDSMVQMKAKRESIYKEIELIVGPNENLLTTYNNTFDSMIGGMQHIHSPASSIFYLVNKSTIKDYLRKGGQLPDFSYDKQTDKVQYALQLNATQDQAGNKFEMTFPVSSLEALEAELQPLFAVLTNLQQVSVSMIMHEVVETCLAARIRRVQPYMRWFMDGFANVITYEILKEHVSDTAAESFLQAYTSTELDTIKNQINLEHWLILDYAIGNDVPLEKEKVITHARYCYATNESKRLMDAYGIGCVRKILDAFNRNDNSNDGSIYQAIKEITGEDLKVRFQQYQAFSSKKEGLGYYVNRCNQAQADGDRNEMLFNALRSFELYTSPIHPESWETRRMISVFLYEMGHVELADKAMNGFLEYIQDLNIPQAEIEAKRNFAGYAVQLKRPQIAIQYANDILEKNPEDVVSFAVKMYAALAEADRQTAEKLALKICELEKQENSYFFQIAQEVLTETKPIL